MQWHDHGDKLLKDGKYLDFADGLIRLIRQLDAIGSAIARLPLPFQFSYTAGQGAATDVATRGMGTSLPTRGPTAAR